MIAPQILKPNGEPSKAAVKTIQLWLQTTSTALATPVLTMKTKLDSTQD
jgi:hypothetical protein